MKTYLTPDEIHELFNKYAETSEYLDFDQIEDKLHPSAVLCGYLKIASLMKSPDKFQLSAQHDVVYLADANELEMTEDDVLYLVRCGIHYDSSIDCLADFT